MLTPTDIQYLVGLLAASSHPTAIDVQLGDVVYDVATKTKRDVDVTVTVTDDAGQRIFKGLEVNKRSRALSAPQVEQLCVKFLDMPSITHRAIVSASGYSLPACRKAAYHGVELLELVDWEGQHDEFATKIDPNVTFTQEGYVPVHVDILTNPHKPFPASARVDGTTPVCGLDGARIPTCPDLATLGRNVMMSAVGVLKQIGVTPPPADPFEVDWTLDVPDTPAVIVEGQIVPIEKVRIVGTIRWSSTTVAPQLKILRRHHDKTPYCGCIVGVTTEGDLYAFSFGPDMKGRVAYVPYSDRLVKGKIYRKSYLPQG